MWRHYRTLLSDCKGGRQKRRPESHLPPFVELGCPFSMMYHVLVQQSCDLSILAPLSLILLVESNTIRGNRGMMNARRASLPKAKFSQNSL